jgi:hypothetical protein
MTIYLVKMILTLYILVMLVEKNMPKVRISKYLHLVLSQLESVSIFDKNFCGSRLKQTLKSVPENGSNTKAVPPGST